MKQDIIYIKNENKNINLKDYLQVSKKEVLVDLDLLGLR